jgi:hypothetical protein
MKRSRKKGARTNVSELSNQQRYDLIKEELNSTWDGFREIVRANETRLAGKLEKLQRMNMALGLDLRPGVISLEGDRRDYLSKMDNMIDEAQRRSTEFLKSLAKDLGVTDPEVLGSEPPLTSLP